MWLGLRSGKKLSETTKMGSEMAVMSGHELPKGVMSRRGVKAIQLCTATRRS